MMTKIQFIPSVDKRISAWMEIQKNRKIEDSQTKPAPISITISREFGCEAYPLANSLKSRLEKMDGQLWTVFEEEMVSKITANDDISRYLVDNLGERSKYLDYIVSALLPYWKSQEQAYRPIVETVFSLARHGNAIIVGQGAFSIAKDLVNCFHFRLIAPVTFRAESYARRAEISVEESEKLVREKEAARIAFLSDFLNCDFGAHNFHMIFNNSKIGFEKIAELIIGFVQH
ncbi:cytidylate kinase-like family protein [bacterium]|nr:cytidylate kinase-like family protein [bacterium]